MQNNANNSQMNKHTLPIEIKEILYLGAVICSFIDDLCASLTVVNNQDSQGIAFLGFEHTRNIITGLIDKKDKWQAIAKKIMLEND